MLGGFRTLEQGDNVVPVTITELKKILVVDDEPAQVRLVDQVLTNHGYEVLKASSGQEALRIIFEQKPALVLLDVVMPGLDGWQTCSRIREVTDIPVIMLTGKRNAEDDIVRGLEYGADEYLSKPVGNKELLARVRASLRRAELPVEANAEGIPPAGIACREC